MVSPLNEFVESAIYPESDSIANNKNNISNKCGAGLHYSLFIPGISSLTGLILTISSLFLYIQGLLEDNEQRKSHGLEGMILGVISMIPIAGNLIAVFIRLSKENISVAAKEV